MKGIDHLVLAGHDLEAMRSHYQALGFTVTPRGQHPFGTGNSLVQLHGTYLEPLAVTAPQDVPEHRAGQFSFAAFNRDYLKRHEGCSIAGARYGGCARRYRSLARCGAADLRAVRSLARREDG